MGVSAVHYRVVTGLYANRMASCSWAPSTGCFKCGRGPDPDPDQLSYLWQTLLLMALLCVTTTHMVDIISTQVCGPLDTWEGGWQGTLCVVEAGISERTTRQLRELLLLSGDVERNPGPPSLSSEDLVSGLADLVGQAPAGMRDILCVWSPDKPSNDIAAELNSRQFTVNMLQPALAWLLNKEVTDPVVKSVKRKADIVQALILGIERLLPDICGEWSGFSSAFPH